MADYEQGRDALQNLVSRESASGQPSRNEASTRFHVINELIEDVLRWPKSAVKVEHHDESGYSDYELGSPSSVVIEAKREGITFVLPTGWDKPIARLETLFSASSDIEASVRQALDYALHRGIPFGAICNGHQLIAFVASRQDGVSPIRGSALIFASLDDMFNRFHQMWDALSPPGVAAGELSRLLNAEVVSAPPEKLAARIVGYPGYKNRNPIATDLQILGGLFLEDIAREPKLEDEFLRETYCTSGALSQYALVSKELLQARYASTFEKNGGVSATPAVTKHGVSEELSRDVLTAGLSRRPILLVGEVGVGKSIFIRHLIKIDAKEAFERAFVLYIDFGSKPALASDLRPYVVREIVRQLREGYGIDVYERNFVHGVYHGELLRFARGIYGDLKETQPDHFRLKEIEHLEGLISATEQHIKACLTHAVKGQQRQVVLFLDNIDQRPSQFQEDVFLIAQAFADQWPLTAFVSLRPATFAQSRAKGSLAAYQPRVFTIDPPRVDLVITRRLMFAKKQLETHGRLATMPEGLTFQSGNLNLYLDMLLRAFENEESIIEFVDNMSADNIRRALDFIASFVGSGHVDSQKILKAEETQTDGYTLPLHEFLRAVAHGDAEYYDPSKSPLINAYDISSRDGREHFLVGLLIAFIERLGQVGGSEGYVTREEVYQFAQGFGFQASQVRSALNRCLEKRLIATPTSLTGDDYSRIRVTTVGAYTTKKLMFMFTYLDAIIVDTPIVDPEVRAQIHDVGTIDARFDRVLTFLTYLETQWSKLNASASDTFDWAAGAAETRSSVEAIRRKLEEKSARYWPT
ncbi:MAG: hypothetical protein AABM67_12000 [Acidobacteriota bacterium]